MFHTRQARTDTKKKRAPVTSAEADHETEVNRWEFKRRFIKMLDDADDALHLALQAEPAARDRSTTTQTAMDDPMCLWCLYWEMEDQNDAATQHQARYPKRGKSSG